METEKAVQGSVAHHEITANQQGQIWANERNGGKQVDDHLRAPVAHLTPWQQITHEGLSHQHQENTAAKQPDQFTWLAVAAVDQAPEHVHIDHQKEGRGPGGMHVAYQPAPGHIAHDVFDRAKGQRRIRLVMHDQENTGHDLDHQNQHRERTEDVKEIEVFRRVVLAHVLFEELGERESVVNPVQGFFSRWRIGWNVFEFSHGRCAPLSFFIFANQQACLGEVHVGWHFEVVWCRLVFVNPTSHVEGGSMARTEKAALPVIRQ